ncbi:MAG TPA: GNAT family protein [Candidatus Aquilonibacter sp.]|nr:GNAT family protein [Candidatus Aquilonibacter sp.]
MGQKFAIRPLAKTDRKDLIDNYFSYWDELKRNPNLGLSFVPKKPALKDEQVWFKNMLNNVKRGNEVASVALVDGKAVGLCNAHRLSRRENAHIAELGIAIRDGYRGAGIGEALMKDVIKRSRGKFEIIQLAVFAMNEKAEKLYRRLNFKEYGRVPNGMKRDGRYTDTILMYLNIKKF